MGTCLEGLCLKKFIVFYSVFIIFFVGYVYDIPERFFNYSIIQPPPAEPPLVIMCVAMPVTTRKMTDIRTETLPFFDQFLPPFVKYSEPHLFQYRLYLGYDDGDAYYDNPNNQQEFYNQFKKLIPEQYQSRFQLKLLELKNVSSPARAASDVSRRCHDEGAEYIFKLNDDISMDSPGFSSNLTYELQNRPIKNFGMVCPNHEGGNTRICVIDYTHRTHLDIFEYHYPRAFTDWYCDNWISFVYGKLDAVPYARKLNHVRAIHHVRMQRYDVNPEAGGHYGQEIERGRKIVEEYVKKHYPEVKYVWGE